MAKSISIPITGNAAPLRKVLDQTEKRIGGFAKGVGKAFAGLATVGAGVTAGLAALGSKFDELENTIIKGTGASGAALDGLVDSAKSVLSTVPDSADLVASTLADVNTFFGETGDQLEATTEAFLDFARVAEVDTNKAIGAVDAAMTQFGETGADVDEVLGDFLRIAQATGAPMDQLLGQMETFGPIFANAGFSIEETAAVLGQLEQAGVQVTRVGPALNRFFRQAAENGEDPRAKFEEFVNVLEATEDQTEALALATEAFGAEGAQRMLSAIRSGNVDLETFGGLLGEGAGLVDEQADAVLTLSDRFAILKNKALVGLAPLAEKVFDAVERAMKVILPVVDRLSAAFDRDGLGGVFRELGNLARQIWPTIKTALGDFLTAFGSWIVDDALPFMGEKAQELGTALVDWVGPRIVPALQALGEFVAAAAQWLIDDGLPMLVDKLKEWGAAFVDWVGPQIEPALRALGKLVVAIGEWVLTDALPKLVVLAADLGGSLVGGFLNLSGDVLKALGNMLADLGRWIVSDGIPSLVANGLSLGSALIGALLDGLSNVGGFALNIGRQVVNGLIGFLNGVIDDINNLLEFRVPLPFGASFTVNPPDIPNIANLGGGAQEGFVALAEGGIVTGPTLALVGEAGPEAVIPLDRAGGMGGAMNITVNMPAGSDGADVVRAVQRYARRTGTLAIPTTSLVR